MEAVLQTAIEIASAMRYLHSVDIVHGDLSGVVLTPVAFKLKGTCMGASH